MSKQKHQHDKPVDRGQQRGFFISVRAGDHRKVKLMLKERQVDVNAADPEDPRGATAIIIASELGDVEMVQILMKAKPKPADVNAETVTGRRAIWCVCVLCVCVRAFSIKTFFTGLPNGCFGGNIFMLSLRQISAIR